MSLFSALSVSASGLSAQRHRAEVLVENLANVETTRTPEGGPYRRKEVVFSTHNVGSPFASAFQSAAGAGSTGVSVSNVLSDTRDAEKRYLPGHPDADQDGYVSFPNSNPAEEMVNLMGASRSYQANVAAMSAVKDMIQKSLELFR